VWRGGSTGPSAEAELSFWSLHAGLPRQAPGSDATTRAMLDALGARPGQRAVDVGCGPGRSALVLAAAGLEVLAVDTHPPFLAELDPAAGAAGLTDRIRTARASMEDLPVADGSVDIVWSEGAAYLMGLPAALTQWPRLLRPGGGLALTDCCWLTEHPSPAAARFWAEGYPSMRTVEETLELVAERGLRTVAHWTLPDSDWEEYYGPLRERVDAAADGAVVRAVRRELDLRAAHGAEYGYVAFVLAPDPGARAFQPA